MLYFTDNCSQPDWIETKFHVVDTNSLGLRLDNDNDDDNIHTHRGRDDLFGVQLFCVEEKKIISQTKGKC